MVPAMTTTRSVIYGQAGGSGARLRLRRRKPNSFRQGLIGSITAGIDS
jgi:hypothetical protein